MEELPKKLPREVRKYPNAGTEYNWDDAIKDTDYAEAYFSDIKNTLGKLGINLFTKKTKVLEIGSGNAIFLDYLRSLGVNAVGVDVRPRGGKQSPQVIAHIEQLPFKDRAFDVVLSLGNVFYSSVYAQDHNAMMREILRVLKSGGVYYASGWHTRNESSPISNLKKIQSVSTEMESIYRKS